jgi:DNA (cytosine-5)-methyltransferase 1
VAAYYNEIDPYAAEWLRNLIAAGHIAPGDVDERSIEDVRPDDLTGFTQCHFFAGIGVWSYALRRAGWPDDRAVWTGSCPCQPFSAAGKGGGFTDERHLWPAFFHLISQCQPAVIFGEQVASKDGLAWLDLVQTDLEATGHTFAPIDICAAGVGAPGIRQRFFFVADAGGERCERQRLQLCERRPQAPMLEAGRGSEARRLEHAGSERRERREASTSRHDHDRQTPKRSQGEHGAGVASAHRIHSDGTGPINGYWRTADWLFCRDDKWRPVEPGTFPLAHGAAARVGRLRAYGNAINAEVAREFVEAYVFATVADLI